MPTYSDAAKAYAAASDLHHCAVDKFSADCPQCVIAAAAYDAALRDTGNEVLLFKDTEVRVGDIVEQRIAYTVEPNEVTQGISVDWLRNRLQNHPDNEYWVRAEKADPDAAKRKIIEDALGPSLAGFSHRTRESIVQAILPHLKEVS